MPNLTLDRFEKTKQRLEPATLVAGSSLTCRGQKIKTCFFFMNKWHCVKKKSTFFVDR
jgi:hypothetical protein